MQACKTRHTNTLKPNSALPSQHRSMQPLAWSSTPVHGTSSSAHPPKRVYNRGAVNNNHKEHRFQALVSNSALSALVDSCAVNRNAHQLHRTNSSSTGGAHRQEHAEVPNNTQSQYTRVNVHVPHQCGVRLSMDLVW